MSAEDITFEEAAKRMADAAEIAGVTVEDFGKYLRLAHEHADDAVKAAGAGRRLRKHLKAGLSIEDIKGAVKALHIKKE
jgi:hypothetical protein